MQRARFESATWRLLHLDASLTPHNLGYDMTATAVGHNLYAAVMRRLQWTDVAGRKGVLSWHSSLETNFKNNRRSNTSRRRVCLRSNYEPGARIFRSAQFLRSATVNRSRKGFALTSFSRLVRPVASAVAIMRAASAFSIADRIATAPAPPAKCAK